MFLDKAGHLALLTKRKEAYGTGSPGDPVVSLRMFDFGGDAAVVISNHVPRNGGKPYYNTRVFVHRDSHWPIAWSQQTTIQAAQAVPAVADKKQTCVAAARRNYG